MITKKQSAYLGLVAKTVITGLSIIFIKIALQHAGAMDLLAHRFTAGAISIGVLWMFKLLKFSPFSWSKAKSLLLLSLFYPLSFFAFQTFGMGGCSASDAGIIFATIPIITLISAGIFLKEKTSLLQKTGALLTVVGVAYIIYRSGNITGNSSLKGLILLLLSVFSMVVYFILGKKISLKFSSLEITAWMILLAFVTFNIWSLVEHFRNGTVNTFFEPLAHQEFFWSVLYLGILSSVTTSFLTNFALSQIVASKISVFNNLGPIITIIGGVVILGETLHVDQIIGGLCVVTGVIMTQIFGKMSTSGKGE